MTLPLRKIFIFLFLTFVFIAFANIGKSHAVSYRGIRKVIVIDFYDKTKKFNAVKASDFIRKELAKRAKFKVLSKSQTIALFKSKNISRRKMLKKSYRKAVGKYLGVDAIVIGVLEKGTKKKYQLRMKMERINTQAPVRIYTFHFNKYIGPKASAAASSRFLTSAGRRTAVAARPKRTPAPIPTSSPDVDYYEEPAQPDQIVRREIPDEQEKGDDVPDWVTGEEDESAKKKRRKKVRFRTTDDDEKEEAESEESESESGFKRKWLTAKLAPAFYKNSYSVTNPAGSAVVNIIDVSTGFFPDVYIFAEAWFFEYIGIDFFYNMGFLTLNVTPPGGTEFSVKTTFTQFGGGLKGRYHFLRDEERSPYAYARFGYTLQKFKPGTQESAVLSSNQYSDIMFGIGAKFPLWFLENPKLGINFSFDYFILSKLSEGVINNGTDNASKGWQMSFGPYWNFWKWLFAGFDIQYNKHSVKFGAPDTAAGSRADVVDGAKSSDSFLGILLVIGMNI